MNCLSRSHRFSSPVMLALPLLLASGAVAQKPVTVTVDTTKTINPLTRYAVSVVPQVGDAHMLSSDTIGLLRTGGLTSFIYPEGFDSLSAAYHWSSNTMTPHPGNSDTPMKPYMDSANDMGHLVTALDKTGITPLIAVNYGSNLKGTGGGDPKEAAAWVAYANGAPDNTKAIGVDASGNDWKTVGFWATLRASEPLATDDGYNFLRVKHPDSLHYTLWQVGEDVAENGYYGVENSNNNITRHDKTLDLHAPYPAALSGNDKRRKLKELSPAFYGDRLSEFSAAMKAVDPTIQIGASLTMPTGDSWATDWNNEVLKSACKSIDFVSFSWVSGNTMPPDWKQLDEPDALHRPESQLPKIITEMLYEDKHSCPAGKVPRVVLSQIGIIPWGELKDPVVSALFAADTYATLAEAGIADASWTQYKDGITTNEGKPKPAYFGTQMFHIIAYRPGDNLVATSGASDTLIVHATKRQDGLYGVMLINEDAASKRQVKVALNGVALGGNGLRFVYGPDQAGKNAGPERSEIKTDGNSIMVDVPAYSIVDLLLQGKAQ